MCYLLSDTNYNSVARAFTSFFTKLRVLCASALTATLLNTKNSAVSLWTWSSSSNWMIRSGSIPMSTHFTTLYRSNSTWSEGDSTIRPMISLTSVITFPSMTSRIPKSSDHPSIPISWDLQSWLPLDQTAWSEEMVPSSRRTSESSLLATMGHPSA